MISAVYVAILVALVVGLAGGLLTKVGPWYQALRKPSWQPPDWLFGPAWTVIFALTAWGGVIGWRSTVSGNERTTIIVLFAINAVLNMAWSLFFFTLRRPDWALIEVGGLWLSILALIVALAPISVMAAWLLAPYLVWVSFASFLNWTVVRLNRPFGVVRAGS